MLSDDTAVMPTFVPDLLGQYEAELVVNDGLTDSAAVTMTITAEGPTADAGDDQLDVRVGDTITLDGSNSTSCAGNTLTYAWELTRPAGSAAEPSDTSSVQTTFIADVAGEYIAFLVVNDGMDSEEDNVIIRTESEGSLQCGDLVSGTIETPGEVDQFTFTGQQGDVVTVTLVETTDWGGINGSHDARATIFSPSGEQLLYMDSNSQNNITLPEDGTYVIQVNANVLVATGSYNLGLECLVPTAPVESALACGDLYSASVDLPGQVDLYTFTGQQGEIVTVTLVETTDWGGINGSHDARATIFSPSGEQLLSMDSNSQHNITLPDDGTYVIRVNANVLVATGSYNLGLECGID